ncbi:hypothetical protein EUGRSUZ_H01493 [Eucalyptus grandis]|uniref:Uncharacterized protein n=2 Tax=Eucalyptus grandis TaxID=71139 RepID=A0ACC3JQ64_EUCGR|nr:hypothetical protein EUGRSUZ_H01493 [Eucalyptus grandis]
MGLRSDRISPRSDAAALHIVDVVGVRNQNIRLPLEAALEQVCGSNNGTSAIVGSVMATCSKPQKSVMAP